MPGILAYGAYVPRTRIGPRTAGWSATTERAVANFDEDTLTLAVAAARDCVASSRPTSIGALYLASTSAPYVEKQASSIAATALDLPETIDCLDVAHSTRAGTKALRLALDSVGAGSHANVLVVASDVRVGAPGSDIEREAGDAAAALLVGDGPAIAEVTVSHALNQDILDVWRADGDRSIHAAADEHFRHSKGYLAAMQACAAGLASRVAGGLAAFDRVVLYAPDRRRYTEAIRLLGLDPGRVEPLPPGVGCTGSSYALLQLTLALDKANAGERILVLDYGDGASATAIDVLPAIVAYRAARRGPIARYQHEGLLVRDYQQYLAWRGLGPLVEDAPKPVAPSPHALWREQAETIRFRGMKCLECGTVQWPAQRVCSVCHARDRAESVRLADTPAHLFSYSLDYIARTPDAPLLLGVVDFDGGGRAMLMVTEPDREAIQVGMPLELTFRKFFSAGGMSNYIWKATPARD